MLKTIVKIFFSFFSDNHVATAQQPTQHKYSLFHRKCATKSGKANDC